VLGSFVRSIVRSLGLVTLGFGLAASCAPPDFNFESDPGVNCDSKTCGGPGCRKCDVFENCRVDSDCDHGLPCTRYHCQPTACGNGSLQEGETDVDCGGPNCITCGTSQRCVENSDCESGGCSAAKRCIANACTDRKKAEKETGIDCGGGTCAPCADGEGCNAHSDCVSNTCQLPDGVCIAAGCGDGLANGAETDVDCSGACPTKCGFLKRCANNSDCESGFCRAGRCQAPSCGDGVVSASETDRDCGGGQCFGCEAGLDCVTNIDCASGVCSELVCRRPRCDDGALNGEETGLDCGGPVCPDCADGEACKFQNDCVSRVCSNGKCQPPGCSDGVLNGDETSVDCGGEVCDACALGDTCKEDSDCSTETGHCVADVCTTAQCMDSMQNGMESAVDCGGRECPKCAPDEPCNDDGDCLSGRCSDDEVSPVCLTPECTDGIPNGNESDTDCGGTCDARCVNGRQCGQGSDCESKSCIDGVCAPGRCDDSVENGNETSLDCGGNCDPCADGSACTQDRDCESGVCDETCQEPACDDGTANGNETDVDCGGQSRGGLDGGEACDPCPRGDRCAVALDCESGFCSAAGLCTNAECVDGQTNGEESDTDCGGACGPTCLDGKSCNENDDCVSRNCVDGSCEKPTCSDRVKNQSETDIDCGGGSQCGPCDEDFACLEASDCQSLVCTEAGVCGAPSCEDNTVNGDESDEDCGGADCDPCIQGQDCRDASDCQSARCVNRVCQSATCSDGVRNGNETDIDCGGTCPLQCDPDEGCGSGADCKSKVCTGGTCREPTCSDSVSNQGESGVDCGGETSCSRCGEQQACGANTDCATSLFCHPINDVCAVEGCGDGFLNGSETDTDCGGTCSTKCSTSDTCKVNGDCVSSNCSASVCLAPSCSDMIRNQGETFTDCGGPESSNGCPRCAPSQTCSSGSDCTSKVCGTGVCQAPTCGDTAQNQDESDVNCGGVTSGCQRCADGRTCDDAGDCDSTRCINGGCMGNAVTALFNVWDGDPADDNNHMKIALGMQNNTGQEIDSGAIRIRYYYSNEPGGTQVADCFGPIGGPANANCEDLLNTNQPFFMPGYLELGFDAGAFKVANGGTTGMWNLMVHKDDWAGVYTQSNDYSYLSRTTAGENRKVVIYLEGVVRYGAAP
jgi:hypothetical protein